MAKQRGLHQIKGKVGEFSYYSQTGVSGGLIRKINEGLSARVKSDAAYANTRLNNQEFGAACNTASLLGQMVTPKFRPMILPFSQSKMCKEILKVARQNSMAWGQRTVDGNNTDQLAAILSQQSKLNFSDFVQIGLDRTSATELTVAYSISGEACDELLSVGANRVTLKLGVFDLATGNFNVITGEMATGYFYNRDTANPIADEELIAGTSIADSEDMITDTFVPAANHSAHQILVAILMPGRYDGTSTHILQQYCSFGAFKIPANA